MKNKLKGCFEKLQGQVCKSRGREKRREIKDHWHQTRGHLSAWLYPKKPNWKHKTPPGC